MARRPAPAAAADTPSRGSGRRAWIGAVLVGAIALAASANSLHNRLVWDDAVTLSRMLVVFRSAGDVLAPPHDIPEYSPDYYRPLVFASYLLDRAIGGDDPFGFHLTVVLAHVATTILVYALALQLFGAAPSLLGSSGRQRVLAALAAGALFAVHPIHTESVAWSAGRTDVFATGFMVAALWVHGWARSSWGGSILSGALTAAALGAKEAAVSLYPLMLLRDVTMPPERTRTMADWMRAYAGSLLAGIVYLLLRRNALGEVVGTAATPLQASMRSPLEVLGAVGVYVGKLLWPARLNAYIDHIDTDPVAIALCTVLVVALVAAAWRWWSARSDGLPLFAVGWIVLTLLPSLSILWKLPDAPIAERYLYLPSVGCCLLAGDGFGRLWARASVPVVRWALGFGLTAVLLAAGVQTVQRNRVWHDDIALFEDTEAKSRESGAPACTLGNAYLEAGRVADAKAAFERALQRRCSPRVRQTAYSNLGKLAKNTGDLDGAQRLYESALQANPDAPDTLFNLGNLLLYKGRLSPAAAQAALPYFARAQTLNPYDADVEAAVAQCLSILGQSGLAAQHAQRAIELGARGPALAIARRIVGGTGS